MTNQNYEYLLSDLAEAAISVTHHDISESEPEYQHEKDVLIKRFRKLLGKGFKAPEAARPVT